MVFLEALHSTMSVLRGSDSLDSVVSAGKSRDVRNFVLNGRFTDGTLDSSSPKCGVRK